MSSPGSQRSGGASLRNGPRQLRIVTNTHRPVAIEQSERDLYAYEHEQRRKIEARDWARVHTAGDKRDALDLQDRPRRWWRG